MGEITVKIQLRPMCAKERWEAAKDALLQAYKIHRGQNPYELCNLLNIKVYLANLSKPFYADLTGRENGQIEMRLSINSRLAEHREFIIFHELAHYFLQRERLHIGSPLFDSDYKKYECLCDNFAFALTLGRCGINIVNEENFREFFEIGLNLEFHQRDIEFMFRFLHLANKHGVKILAKLAQCFYLDAVERCEDKTASK